MRAYHAYGSWLVSISWWRFALLSILLLIITAIAENFPPFNIRLPSWEPSDTLPAPPCPRCRPARVASR